MEQSDKLFFKAKNISISGICICIGGLYLFYAIHLIHTKFIHCFDG